MPVEVTPIIETATEAAVTPPDNDNNSSKNVQETETPVNNSPKNEQQAPGAPKKRGRPVGARDKQPRVFRKQPPPSPGTASSSSERSSERPSERPSEEEPESDKNPPASTVHFQTRVLSPRSQNRNTIAQRRERMATVHLARVSKYTTLLDRMLV